MPSTRLKQIGRFWLWLQGEQGLSPGSALCFVACLLAASSSLHSPLKPIFLPGWGLSLASSRDCGCRNASTLQKVCCQSLCCAGRIIPISYRWSHVEGGWETRTWRFFIFTKGFSTFFFFLALNLLFRIRFNFHTLNNVQLFASERNFEFWTISLFRNEQNCGRSRNGDGTCAWVLRLCERNWSRHCMREVSVPP